MNGAADLVRRRAERDRVARRLARFASVDAGQARRRRQQCLALRQDLRIGQSVDAPDDLVGLLDHRHLIVADGDESGAKRGDVGRLAHGIAEEAGGNVAREAALLDLRLHRWVSLEARHGDEVHVQRGEIGERGQLRLQRDRRAFGIDPDGEVVERHFEHVRGDVRRPARVVSECLQVGDEERLLMALLQRESRTQRAGVVAEVERTGGTVTGEDGVNDGHDESPGV